MNPLLCNSNLYPGIETYSYDITFCECKTDWVWIAKQVIQVSYGDGLPWSIHLAPYLSSYPTSIMNCELDDKYEYPLIWTNIMVNGECVIGTEESSRGAIKSMYK